MGWCADKGLPHSEILEWDVEDRAKLHAWLLEESGRCGLCGTMEWEWQENRYAYTPVEKNCPGCYARHIAGEETDRLPGTTIILVPSSSAFLERQRLGYEKAIRERKKAKADESS